MMTFCFQVSRWDIPKERFIILESLFRLTEYILLTLKACGHFVNEDLKKRMAEDVNSYQATWMSLCSDVRGSSTASWAAFFNQECVTI